MSHFSIPPNVTLIGLLGGIASGKSLVAKLLAERGAVVLDADKLGHQVLTEPNVISAIRAEWPKVVSAEGSQVDRKLLAAIVFDPTPAGAAALARLESITHPRIHSLIVSQLAELAAAGKPVVAVLDAPVMIKTGWHKMCHRLIFVDAPRPIRFERAKSRGWTAADFSRREARQEPVEFKRNLADTVIDNSGDQTDTAKQVERFWTTLSKRER